MLYPMLLLATILGAQTTLGQMAPEPVDGNTKGHVSTLEGYVPSMTVTADGRTAYFSQGIYKKPLYGLFSKKELVYEVYRAEKINGQWANFTKLPLCPEQYSAKHPAVSADGKRLFFASNMRGSYGKYDIYVAEINKDGSMGVSKNLGPKVNTKEDELYPDLHNGTLLFFASEGHGGFGGLDLYATQVAHNRLTPAVNLGRHINSDSDEYAIALSPEKKMGFVVSNRGYNNTIAQYGIAYGPTPYQDLAQGETELRSAMNTTVHPIVETSFEE